MKTKYRIIEDKYGCIRAQVKQGIIWKTWEDISYNAPYPTEDSALEAISSYNKKFKRTKEGRKIIRTIEL